MIKNISMQEYRDDPALSNHELQIFRGNPSNYIWNKNAPQDPAKATTSEIGTALHALLLEPDTYDDLIIVSDVKGRTTVAFQKLQLENPDNIVLTEVEAEHIKFMALSAKCNPMFEYLLSSKGACESSIFVTDPETGLELKIRPDKIVDNYSLNKPLLGDVKTTANLDDWRSDVKWENPLFAYGYGFTAAYYLYVGSIHFGVELDEYCFLVVQSSASLGKYPASVFTITKDELIHYGFWQEMLETLRYFKACKDSNNWLTKESFPEFYVPEDETFNLDNVEVVDA